MIVRDGSLVAADTFRLSDARQESIVIGDMAGSSDVISHVASWPPSPCTFQPKVISAGEVALSDVAVNDWIVVTTGSPGGASAEHADISEIAARVASVANAKCDLDLRANLNSIGIPQPGRSMRSRDSGPAVHDLLQ